MAWVYDTYDNMHPGENNLPVVTGKPLELGGSEGRDEATGRGCVFAAGAPPRPRRGAGAGERSTACGSPSRATARSAGSRPGCWRSAAPTSSPSATPAAACWPRTATAWTWTPWPRTRPRPAPSSACPEPQHHQRRPARAALRRADPGRPRGADPFRQRRRRCRPAHRRGRQPADHPGGGRHPRRQGHPRAAGHPRQRRRRHRQLLRVGAEHRAPQLAAGRDQRPAALAHQQCHRPRDQPLAGASRQTARTAPARALHDLRTAAMVEAMERLAWSSSSGGFGPKSAVRACGGCAIAYPPLLPEPTTPVSHLGQHATQDIEFGSIRARAVEEAPKAAG
jgi:hypothetical protein